MTQHRLFLSQDLQKCELSWPLGGLICWLLSAACLKEHKTQDLEVTVFVCCEFTQLVFDKSCKTESVTPKSSYVWKYLCDTNWPAALVSPS